MLTNVVGAGQVDEEEWEMDFTDPEPEPFVAPDIEAMPPPPIVTHAHPPLDTRHLVESSLDGFPLFQL